MFWFKAHFIDDKVYINDCCYHSNELLTAYLNLNVPKLEELLERLYIDRDRLPLREADYEHCKRYNRYAEEGQNDLYRLGNVLKTIPPYNTDRMMEYFDTPQLYHCLYLFDHWVYPSKFKNKPQSDIGKVNIDNSDEWLPNEDVAAMYGQAEDAEDIEEMMFYPDPYELEEPSIEVRDQMDWTNSAIKRLLNRFILVTEDIVRVKKAYSEFLDHYIHAKNRYLTEAETAEAFAAFAEATQTKAPIYRVISGSGMELIYEIFTDPNGDKHLCEGAEFNSLGAFLYFDFFRGLALQSMPRRCSNCGKYFLQRTGKYSSYCERPLKDDKTKTCRDVGAKRKYADKCKTDPVWLTYNRAYKAHYARYMKKKMTTAEFEQWSRYAVELREKALAEELDLEEYIRIIKQ